MTKVSFRVDRIASVCRNLFVAAVGAQILLPMAADAADFKGKTVTIIVGAATGGGSDLTPRLIQPFLEKHLPGTPTVVIRNMPGADGVLAIEYVHRQSAPDGLMLMTASNSALSPANHRRGGGTYDAKKFGFVGGISRGGTVLLINTSASPRLTDKSQPPLNVGVVDARRASTMVAGWGAEYLGWNIRWVQGYSGSADTVVALERGEVDIVTNGNPGPVKRLVETGKFHILNQSGGLDLSGKYVGRPEFGNGPLFTEQLKGKVTDAVAVEAFGNWESENGYDKWIALRAETPKDILDTYRQAWSAIIKDPDYIERAKKADEGSPLLAPEVERLVAQMINVSRAAENYPKVLLEKQGLKIE